MSYAIVGFGKIGQALARAFARKNIKVTVASRRPPEALAPQARAIGPTVVAKSVRDALDADTIILAVPFGGHREIANALPSWKGKTVIDAMNALVPAEELDGLPSSSFVAKSFIGAKFVKGLITWLRPLWRPIRSSRGAIGSSFCRATTRTRSLPWRIWPNNWASHPSTWESSRRVARWCTHAAALGVTSSSRICSRRSSSRLRLCELAREVGFQSARFDRTRSDVREMERFR